jgi:phospholipid transport system substrate-binding protein
MRSDDRLPSVDAVALRRFLDGDNAIVRARVITRKGTEVPVESRLLRHGDRWLMYDVLLENVSLVGNYRTQFNRIIQQSSFDELMKKLKTKQDELVFEESGKKKP